MSVVKDAYEAVNEGRFQAWAAANLPPEFELVPLEGSLFANRFEGPDGASTFFADLAQAWETLRIELEELVEAGDRVVALGRVFGRGRGSGMELEAGAAHVWTVVNAVPVRVDLIGDREQALRIGRGDASL